ncbi:MAG: YkvA family protein [Fidelibacterota bacterium]
MPETDKGYRGFYEDLVEKVQDYEGRRQRTIRLAPKFFKLMTNLLEDRKTPKEARSLISSAIAYFVVPRDVIPEKVFGPLALIDDVFVCLHVTKKLSGMMDNEWVSTHWEGDESLVDLVDELYPLAEKYVGHAKEKILNYVGLDS